MAAELIQVRMTKSVDFASRGELVWLEPVLAKAIVGMSLAVVVREQEVADGKGEREDHDQPAGGHGGRRNRKREAGQEDRERGPEPE